MSDHAIQQRDHDSVRLLHYLFDKRFCPAESIADDRRPEVMLVYFAGWLDKNLPLMSVEEVCAAAKVNLSIWEFVREIVDGGVAPERLASVWPFICLGHRPLPEHEVQDVAVNLVIKYKDGHIFPMQVFVSEDMLDDDCFTDAGLTSIVVEQFRKLVQERLMMEGIDKLHARGQNYRGVTPEDPFEVLMGLVLKHGLPMIRQDLRKGVEDYLRLYQGMIRPVLAQEVKAQLAAKRAERDRRLEKSTTPSASKSTGGWNQ